MSAMIQRIGRTARGALAIVGAGTLAVACKEYYDAKEDASGKGKNQVLVLPFHRLKIVEQASKNKGWDSAFYTDGQEPIEITVADLITVIHQAARDDNVSALFGIFGHGFMFEAGGWAHLEEIRTALQVWKQAHRSHPEPNLKYKQTITRDSVVPHPKPSFCFADSFGTPLPENHEYMLATAFSEIHLQQQGEVNLFGVAASSTFYRKFLQKYGILAHVFKHGKYKTAPNRLTESGFTKEHYQMMRNIVDQLDAYKKIWITKSRNFTEDDVVWRMVRNHGTFTASESLKLGLVDYLCPLNPLHDLLLHNNTGDKKKQASLQSKWKSASDLETFKACKEISLPQYLQKVKKRQKIAQRQAYMDETFGKLASASSATESLLGLFGYKVSGGSGAKNKKKICILKVTGTIHDAKAASTIQSLRQIEKDASVKAIVLRIDSPGGSVNASEAIYQHLKDINIPVVCSMSNIAASGGYYIAAPSERIFCLPTTLTGSIGVFGIKFDLTGLARRYGIHVEHLTTGPYAAASHPFMPLNSAARRNFSDNVDRYYDAFKALVAKERSLENNKIDSIAQGKVYTGIQAKDVGLVDELGGLERAIAYAQRSYVKDASDVVIEEWPKKKSLIERLAKLKNQGGSFVECMASLMQDSSSSEISDQEASQILIQTLLSTPEKLESMEGVAMMADESAAIRFLVKDKAMKLSKPLVHPSIWSSN